jgi:hypothetical protein
MASIRKQVEVEVDAAKAWAALRSVGEAHKVFGPVLADARLDRDMRTATFGNGMVVHERILDVDDERRRVAYTVTDAPGVAYHHASMEVIDRGAGKCGFVWITDVFPPEATSMLAPMIDAGAKALKSNLEGFKT